jgi:hypothetical protein
MAQLHQQDDPEIDGSGGCDFGFGGAFVSQQKASELCLSLCGERGH